MTMHVCLVVPMCGPQTVKAFLPQMKAQNHGHIVTIASVLGLFSTACVEVSQYMRNTATISLYENIINKNMAALLLCFTPFSQSPKIK